MDDISYGDYVDIDDIQIAPELTSIEKAIRSKYRRLEYFAQYRLHCAVYLDIWNTIEGHASVFVILVRKKTSESASGHVSLTQSVTVLEKLKRFTHSLAQGLLYREKECQLCSTNFERACIRLVCSDPYKYLRKTEVTPLSYKLKKLS